MVRTVPAVAQDEAEVVVGLRHRRRDAQVVGKPVPGRLVPAQVAVAGLHEDSQRLAGHLRNERRVGLPSGVCTKLGRQQMTRRKASGRSHAAVKAQLPPLLNPQMPQRSCSSVIDQRFVNSGMTYSRRNVTYRSSNASYSTFLCFRPAGFSASRRTPGRRRPRLVTCRSPRLMRLSSTVAPPTSSSGSRLGRHVAIVKPSTWTCLPRTQSAASTSTCPTALTLRSVRVPEVGDGENRHLVLLGQNGGVLQDVVAGQPHALRTEPQCPRSRTPGGSVTMACR